MTVSIIAQNRVLRRRRNDRKIAALAGPIAIFSRIELDLDGLAAILHVRKCAEAGANPDLRRSARVALQRWKKQRGWRHAGDKRKRGTRWTPRFKLG